MAHRHMFYNALHFGMWYRVLSKDVALLHFLMKKGLAHIILVRGEIGLCLKWSIFHFITCELWAGKLPASEGSLIVRNVSETGMHFLLA